MRRGEKDESHAFFLGRLNLFVDRRHIFALAAIEDGGLRAHAQDGARGIDGRIAAADDRHAGADRHLLAARHRLKERQRRMDVLQLGARQIKPGLLPCSDGDEDGVEARGQIVERQIEADARVEDQLHAHAFDEIEFAAQNGFGQPVLGNGEAQHAAGFAALFKDGDLVAEHGQVEGGGEAGGAGTGDGDLAAGGRELALLNALQHRRRSDRTDRWSRR